ncbi:MAG: Uma2 family endonuclease [Chloroflexota bacterium]
MSVASMAAAPPTVEPRPLRMTYDEFLAWADEDTHAEWVDGEVIVPMPTKDPHQTMVEFLYYVLRTFVKFFNLGRVRIAPFELKLSPDGNSREPDLMVITNDRLDRLTYDRVNGAPDLIVEIVSKDSVSRDRVTKFDEYEAGGVPEYWIIDNRPERQRAQFYQLDERGQYQPVSLDADGVYHSRVLPGFWLKVEWLWAATPDEWEAIAAVIGPERMYQALQNALEQGSAEGEAYGNRAKS